MSVVKEYKIPFLSILLFVKTSSSVHITKTQGQTIENGIKELLEKEAIKKVENTSEKFLRNMFLEERRIRKPSNDNSQMSGRFYTLPAFQNKRFAFFKIYAGGKQFPMQN